MEIRQKTAADQPWIETILEQLWASRDVAVHGELFDAASLPALIAGDRLGLLTYRADPPRAGSARSG